MKKVLRIGLISLILFIVLGTFVFLFKKSQTKEFVYELVTPQQKDLSKLAVVTGKIEPRDEVNIKPQISGIIDEIYKKAGEKVAKGDVIAKVKVIPDMGQLNSAESGVRMARINLKQVEKVFSRVDKLYKEKLVSREEYEKVLTDYNRAKEQLLSSEDALNIIKDGISENSKTLSNTLIRSTIDGLVLDVPVKKGNSVIQSNTFNEGTTIATIANMSDLIFKGNVDETEVVKMNEGMMIKLTIGAMPDNNVLASMEYISPKGREINGTSQYDIKAAVNLPKNLFIRAGYSASGEVVLDSVKAALSIPERCVEFKGDSSFVYILKNNTDKQEFSRQYVTLGLSNGIDVAVLKGLTENDMVRGKIIN